MAKKQRFRDIKQNRVTSSVTEQSVNKPTIPFASNGIKAKAFLTDIFMLFMPIMYIVIYLIMDGREGAAHDKLLAWSYVMVPFLSILTIFMFKDKGRTPGARSQGLRVIDIHTLGKPSLFSLIFRNFSLLFTLFIPIFWFFSYFRKDRQSLHDLLSATSVIVDSSSGKSGKEKPTK